MSMGLGESVKVALDGLNGNKLRSSLTMLGVIIGVAAVITMISIGQGARKQVTSQIQGLGSNLLSIMPGRGFGGRPGVPGARGGGMGFDNKIWEQIPIKCQSVLKVSPESSSEYVVKSSTANTTTRVMGVAPGWDEIRNTKVEKGSSITAAAQESRLRVAVVGKTVITDLFAGNDPIGQTIRINGVPFSIIGILESKGSSGFQDNDDRIIVPVSTFQRRLEGSTKVRNIYVQVKSAELMTQATNEVTAALKAEGLEDDEFYVMNQAELLTTAQASTKTLTLLLAGIAAVSLLVGGIGIMNIMLVSVTERTREIGLRKALGARRQDILLQFMIESVTLSGIGGILGILVGLGGGALVSKIAGWSTAVDILSIGLAFCFSAAVGLFFGVYPANKASRLNPIEALRYD